MQTITTTRAEKIARNINAMDIHFEYSDDGRVYKFWLNLKIKLTNILKSLTEEDKSLIASLCEDAKREYFNLKQTIKPMKKTFRTKVFKRAYKIMKATKKTFAICLSKAWALYRLTKQMRNKEEVHFTYEKKDGSLRKAFGTLKNVSQFVKGTGKTSITGVFKYWDLEALAFRSFQVQNLITVY